MSHTQPEIAHAKLDSSGMKARPCKPAPPHDAVHQECCSRHVAEILQKEDEQREDRNFL